MLLSGIILRRPLPRKLNIICHRPQISSSSGSGSGTVPLDYKIYSSASNGAPLYILHGLYGSKSNWNSLAKRFALNRTVITVDSRNHGASPTSDQISYDLMRQDLFSVIQKLGHQKIHLMGHSMGGKTSMLLALTNPDLVEKLVIVDVSPARSPATRGGDVSEALLQLQFHDSHSIHEARKYANEQLSQKFPDTGLRHFLLTNIVKENNKFRLKVDPQIIKNNFEELRSWVDVDQSMIFHGPTLFIGGGDSPYISKETEPEIKRLFPMAEIQHIAGAGHWVHAAKPHLFLEAVEAFLSK